MGEIRTAYDSDIFQSGVDTGQDEQVWGQVEPTNALAKILAETASADIRSTDLKDEKKTIAISNNFVVGVEQGSRLAHKISRICIAQLSPYDNDLPLTKITSDDMMHMGYTRERLTAHMNEVLDEILNYRIKLSVMRRIQKDSQMTGINVFAQASNTSPSPCISFHTLDAMNNSSLLTISFSKASLKIVPICASFP